MRITIFGASGATGRELVSQARAAGHDVSVFARSVAGVARQDIRVCQGDIVDAAAVRAALENQDAVLSALGAPSPFQPYPAFLDGIRNIVTGLEAAGPRRFLYLSFVGVPESRHQFGFVGQHLIAPWVLRQATEGHRLNEEIIRASPIDWTIVRAPKLTDGPRTSAYRMGEDLKSRGFVPTIARADVAEAMLQELGQPRYVRCCVTVMH